MSEQMQNPLHSSGDHGPVDVVVVEGGFAGSIPATGSDEDAYLDVKSDESPPSRSSASSRQSPVVPASADEQADEMLKSAIANAALNIPETKTYLYGLPLAWHRYRAMFTKRFRYSSRDRKAVISQVRICDDCACASPLSA